MNNKTIIEFGFRIIEELWRSRRVLSASAHGLDGSLMSRIDLVSKNLSADLLAFVFAIVAKEIIEKNYVRKSLTHIAKKTNLTRIKTYNKRKQEGLRNVRKYRKNRKSNKDFSC